MRKLILVLLAVFLVNCNYVNVSNSVSSYNIPDNDAGRLKDSTVLMLQERSEKYYVMCSGVWLSENTFLTAFHCVERDPITQEEKDKKFFYNIAPNVVGESYNYKTYRETMEEESISKDSFAEYILISRAKVYATNRDKDLALLVTEGKNKHHSWVNIADDVEDGQKALLVGHVRALSYNYIEGVVAAQRRLQILNSKVVSKVVQIDAASWRGYSGGGAFNEDGELIGICSFLLNFPQGTFYVHRDEVAEFLKEHGIK